jgi:hypothetical protein
MSYTPLSDKITALINLSDSFLIEDFERCFLTSSLGVIFVGLPTNFSPGQSYTISSSDTIESALVSDPKGRPMMKACADPSVFEEKYNAGINALMTGKEILEMLMKLSDVDGVLVCSAATFNSYPIYRDRAKILLKL